MGAKVAGIEVEAIEYDREPATVRTQFDQEKTPASIAVTATLAEVMEADPVELDPLHSTVDPDALNTLLSVRNRPSGDTHVTFTHESHVITVHSYGSITITPEHDQTATTYESHAGR